MNHQVLNTYFERSGLPWEEAEKKVSPKFAQFLSGAKEKTRHLPRFCLRYLLLFRLFIL